MSEFKVEDSGFWFSGLGFKFLGSVFRVQSLGVRVKFVVRIQGLQEYLEYKKTHL